jgi:hypothetical protein
MATGRCITRHSRSRTIDGRLTYPVLIEALDPALVGMQYKMSTMLRIGNPITYFGLVSI